MRSRKSLSNRILALLLTLVMIIGVLPTAVYSVDTEETGNVTETTETVDPTETTTEDATEESTEDATEESTEESTEDATEEPEVTTVTLTITRNGNGTVKVDGEEVVFENNTAAVQVEKDRNVRITIEPDGTYIKKLVIKDVEQTVEKNAVYDETVSFDADAEIRVTFVAEYSVTATANEGGSVTMLVGDSSYSDSVTVDAGTQVAVEIKAEDAYEIASITVDGAAVEITNAKVHTLTVNESAAIAVTFVRAYTVKVTHNSNGSITVEGNTVSSEGTVQVRGTDGKIVIVATPAEDYRVSAFKVTSGGETVVDETFDEKFYVHTETVAAKDYEVTVTFAESVYAVSLEATDKGSYTDLEGETITSLTVEHGEDAQFMFKPGDGYVAKVYDGETQLVPVDGVYTVAGIREAHSITVTVADTKAPDVEVSVENANGWAQYKKIVISASDNSGVDAVVSVYVSLSGDYATEAALQEAGLTAAESHTVHENGRYWIYAFDAAGNLTKTSVEVYHIDLTGPVFSEVTQMESGHLWWKQVTYTFTVVDEDSGIKQVWYSLNTNGGDPVVLTADENGVYSFTVSANDMYYIFAENNAEGEDGFGIITYVSQETSNIDTAVPEIESLTLEEGWNKESLTVALSAKDNIGVAAAYWTTVPYDDSADIIANGTVLAGEHGEYTFEAESNGTYYIYAMDDAQNFDVQSVVVNQIDKTKPTVATIQKTPDTTWHNDTVEVSGTVHDKQDSGDTNGSGIACVVYSTSADGYPNGNYALADYNNGSFSFTVPAENFNGTYYVWAVDNCGWVSEVNTINVAVDTDAPVNVAMAYVEDVDHGFVERIVNVLTFGLLFRDQIYISVQAEDTGSGIQKYQYQMVPDGSALSEDGWVDYISSSEDVDIQLNLREYEGFLGKVYVRVYDVAGNVTGNVSDTAEGTLILLDNVTPDIVVNLNDYEADTWTKDDVVITLSGADTAAGVKSYEYKVVYADGTIVDWADMPESTGTQNNKADAGAFIKDKLVITADTNATFWFKAVGNNGLCSDAVSVNVKVRKTIPENATVTITSDGEEIAPNANGWYGSVYPTITIDAPVAADNEPAITTYYSFWNSSSQNISVEDMASVEYDGESPEFADDGIYFLIVHTEDEAGNSSEYVEYQYKVDITNPVDLGVTIDDVSVIGEKQNPDDAEVGMEIRPYKETVTAKLFAADEMIQRLTALAETQNNVDPSDLVLLLEYQLVDPDADCDDNAWMEYPEEGIELLPNTEKVIWFRATDAAGNVTKSMSDIIIVDDQAPGHMAPDENGEDEFKPQIIINVDSGESEVNGIYTDKSGVTVNITAVDPSLVGETLDENGCFSGLQKVSYIITATDTGKTSGLQTLWEATPESEEEETEGEIADENEIETETHVVLPGDFELTQSVTSSISIDAEEFNSNHVVVTIIAVDNAGNERTTSTEEIMIDISEPVITISYDENTPATDGYYNVTRVATIEIQERNFDENAVNILVTRDNQVVDLKSLIDTESIVWTLKETEETEENSNGDERVHVAQLTFSAEGEYTFNIQCADKAGWTCGNFTTDAGAIEYDKEVVYSNAQNPTAFTIDKTAPVVRISYDNNNAANGKYFNATRTATVAITELNYDQGRVKFEQTADRGGVAPDPEWAGQTAVFHYTLDGDYTFDLNVTDKAGNVAVPDYGNTVAGNDFVIDTTYENMIAYSGVANGTAYGYGEDVVPGINITDINLDEYTVTLVGVQKDQVNDLTDEVNALLKADAQSVEGTFDLFEAIQEMDGIYTLTITSLDLAGNQDSEEIVFSVNRFGSVYVYSDYLLGLIADGGAYVLDITEDLVISEYNANKLLDDSLVIEITCDGKPLENVMYTVSPEINDAVAPGDSGWYQYKYVISKDNFDSDGVYKISVSSRDAAGNKPENNSYENLSIAFRVDSTPAEITSIVGLEEAIINATDVTVKYTVFDTMGIKSIQVYVDGELVDDITDADLSADMNNFSGDFVLYEKKTAQHVRIVVEDMSGNVTDTDAENFSSAYEFHKSVTVSTNIFVRWYADKTLFWGSIAGVAILAAALWIFLVAKRKK